MRRLFGPKKRQVTRQGLNFKNLYLKNMLLLFITVATNKLRTFRINGFVDFVHHRNYK
jgi:hypothetical protein